MHEIQMLGLLDHDVLSSIEVPYLPEQYASLLDPTREGNFEAFVAAKREADKFDMEIFEFKGLECTGFQWQPHLKHIYHGCNSDTTIH
jgi:hypothetical protein